MAQYPRMIPLVPLLAVFVGVAATHLHDAGLRASRPSDTSADDGDAATDNAATADRRRLRLRQAAALLLAAAFVFAGVYTAAAVAGFNQSRQQATDYAHDAYGDGDTVTVYSQRVYLPEFPDDVTVDRYEIHAGSAEPIWRPGVRALACNRPEHVVVSSYHYDRFFKDPAVHPNVTEQFRRLFDGDGYRVRKQFGPPADPRVTAREKLFSSVDFHSYEIDGNPTIVFFERTGEPKADCPGAQDG